MLCQVIVKGFVLRDTFNSNYFRFSITLIVLITFVTNNTKWSLKKFEGTKGLIRSMKQRKEIQCNDQKKKDKQ
jgi:membrane-bound acyltransferase YfiQ involved in biofilm formation